MRTTAATLCLLTLVGCSNNSLPPTILGGFDAAVPDRPFSGDFGGVPDIPSIDPCRPAPCMAVDLCGPARDDGTPGSGNGLDDNCDGRVDEGCRCQPGEVRACFPGPSDRRNLGICRDGMMRCTELGAWVGNECTGATTRTTETCDGRDEDCNGSIDDGLMNCQTALRCPPSAGVAPLQTYSLDARTIDPMARSFRWTVECPEGVTPCPEPPSATDPVLRYMPVRVGLYRVSLAFERADGRMDTCRFPLYVQGRGLRIELDWDRKGGVNSPGVDLDLHVTPIDRTIRSAYQWFTRGDCYFATCKAPGGIVNWATSMTDTRFAPAPNADACLNAPPPFGDAWRTSGRCWNPRLDTDDIVCDPTIRDSTDPDFCFPENFVVDDPPDNVTFRVGVNFYRDHGACTDMDARNDLAHPTLTIACGGLVRGVVGSVDDGIVTMRCADNPDIGSGNWTWLAADVRVYTNACGVRECRVTPLRGDIFRPCAMARPEDDVCSDTTARVFIRNAAARDVLAEFPESE